ncbi:hypothetical protein [Kitasatospora sp. NPDC085879]
MSTVAEEIDAAKNGLLSSRAERRALSASAASGRSRGPTAEYSSTF